MVVHIRVLAKLNTDHLKVGVHVFNIGRLVGTRVGSVWRRWPWWAREIGEPTVPAHPKLEERESSRQRFLEELTLDLPHIVGLHAVQKGHHHQARLWVEAQPWSLKQAKVILLRGHSTVSTCKTLGP